MSYWADDSGPIFQSVIEKSESEAIRQSLIDESRILQTPIGFFQAWDKPGKTAASCGVE